MAGTEADVQTRDGVKIRYWVRGSGEPLALIMGFSGSGRAWGEPFLDRLERRFKLILIDNRGTGMSDKPDREWTLVDMAADAVSVLDDLKITRAHVMGVSMGGMIAQEFALNFADRLKRLILGCTNCGASHSIQAAPEIAQKLLPNPDLSPREQSLAAMSLACAPAFFNSERGRAFVDFMIDEQAKYAITPMHTFQRQMGAISQFDSFERLPQIKNPTLVLTGDTDALIPCENSSIIQQQIPGAKLAVLKGLGHMFLWEDPALSTNAVINFLLETD
jgi:3-oxoadipate enol-lactonase